VADRGTSLLPSFNAGELSKRLQGRVDQSVYGIGCSEMLGWLATVEGCAVAAPGSHYVERAAGPCRLIPFEYSPTEGYVIEASNGLLRFYTNDVRIETGPTTPYTVAHPYAYAELARLDYQQSADVLYLAGGGRQQMKLSRTGATAFTLAALDLANGPIGDGNDDTSLTILASATTGSVTLTGSAAIFALTDVGSLIELEAADFNDIPSWEAGITIASGQKRTWDGKVYLYSGGGAGRTGTVPPSHDSGTEWDGSGVGTDVNTHGPYGVPWTFLYGRFGLARITAFTDTTHVTATVIKRLADSLTSTASWRWAFGAFSDTRGWPDVVCEWNECLVFCKDADVYVSVIGDFENHERRDSSGDFQRDLAGRFRIPHGGRIKWAAPDRLLLIGTDRGEYTVERLQVQTGTAGPPVFDVKLQSSSGSAAVKPIQADGRMVFVQRAGKKLLEMAYAISTDRYETPELTRLARQIGGPGFVEIAWQQEPERTVWAVRGDGTMAALAYSPTQQVMGWSRRELGAGLAARSLCRITSPDGGSDQIWIAAEVIAGEKIGQWWVLRMHPAWEEGGAAADAVFLDAALSYAGTPVSSGSGADHLQGLTVSVLADGKPHPDIVIALGGHWNINFTASKVTLGLPYPARLTPMRVEAGQSEGTAQGKIKRVVALGLRFLESLGVRVRVQGEDWQAIETRDPDDDMNAALSLFTGDYRVDTIGDFESDGLIHIERFQPLPAALLAIVPFVETGEQ
jgi:hypothetical protein